MTNHTISVLVSNEVGVLSRIVDLFQAEATILKA